MPVAVAEFGSSDPDNTDYVPGRLFASLPPKSERVP